MKSSHASIVMFLVGLFFTPAGWPQAPASENQSGASPAQRFSVAEVPRLIKFSGTLLDGQERPLAGPVGVTFALYAQQTGGAALWLETENVKPDGAGNYTVLLGANSANGVPAELFASGEARWLGIQVGQQPEHERILLVSVPYALKAGDAETLGGLPASAFVTTNAPGNTANSGGAAPASSSSATPGAPPKSGTAAVPKNGATTQAACASVTSDGTATTNSIALFSTACNVQSSLMTQASINGFPGVNLAGNNAGLLLSGTGTHQVTVTGATSGRLGQDTGGFFFASDTNGKSVRFLTNNGTLNEWMRITSAGNIGIGTTAPQSPFHIAGGNNWNLPASEGDFKIGNATLRLKMGVALAGGGAGDARIYASGGTNRMILGTGTTDVLTVAGTSVGIGTITPAATLHVVSAAATSGDNTADFFAPNIGANHSHIHFGSTGNWYIRSASSAGVVVLQDLGGNVGIGTGTPAVKLDVAGAANFSGNTTNQIVSVTQAGNGTALSASSGFIGVHGTGVTYGVIGTTTSGNGAGILGQAGPVGSTGGAFVDNGPGTFAGQFTGNVNISGTLTKGAGSFKIDHPLDPANKYLSHSFVESPDMMNIYDGMVMLDKKGEAWVNMPDWFEALNRDFRYQLTAIGAPQKNLYIKNEITGNRFKIAGGKPGGKVSWLVTGVRQDAYAKAHPIAVEQDKPPQEQGYYLHPEAFGQPTTKSISAARNPVAPTSSSSANVTSGAKAP